MSERPALAVYGALSRKKSKRGDDDRTDEESVDSQIENVLDRLGRLYPDADGGYDLLGVFSEVGHSGSKKNRGPELERAITAVTAAADAGRTKVELWANTSARLGRGTGKRDEARAVGELFYDLRRRGVALRTVEDDEFVTNELLIGFASKQASKYSEDLSESITRSKRRQAEAGYHLGGPAPIGLLPGPRPDAKAPPAAFVRDPSSAPTVERILDLALQGVPDGLLARTVNAEGHRSRAGRPFDRRSIQAIVLNPIYAGLILYGGEEFEARSDYPRFITADEYRRMVAARDKRDLGAGRHTAGTAARLHLLSRLAVCGRCGAPMYATTSSYRRKSDGGRARTYACRSYRNSDGTCDAKPIDAETVDTAVMERLGDLLPDIDQWVEQLEGRHRDERARLAAIVDQAEQDRDARAAAGDKHARRYRTAVANDDGKVDLLLEFVEQARAEVDAADVRLAAARQALDSIPENAPHDQLLDFALDLRDAIRGKTADAKSVEDVNRALIETFSCFAIWDGSMPPPPDDDVEPRATAMLPEDWGVHAGHVMILPTLRHEVVNSMARDSDGKPIDAAPPLRWIEAVDQAATIPPPLRRSGG